MVFMIILIGWINLQRICSSPEEYGGAKKAAV